MDRRTCWPWMTSVVVLPCMILAQGWPVRYDGPDHGYDAAWAIAVDDHGAVYVTGASFFSVTNNDYMTIRYDSTGVERWKARYDGPANNSDNAHAIALDNRGNVYVTGSSYGAGLDYATIKYDSLGAEKWVARYDGLAHDHDLASQVAVDGAGNVYVTGGSVHTLGYDDYDIVTVKYDSLGAEQWVARYNGPVNFSMDWGMGIVIDGGGNVYVTGFSEQPEPFGTDYTTIKYDSLGGEQWVARYDAGNGTDGARAIAIDGVNNTFVTGMSRGYDYDYATVKYDSMGIQQWVARYDNVVGDDDGRALALDRAGNVYVTGWSEGTGLYDDYATVKYDSTGAEKWVARYNGPKNQDDQANAIAVDSEGNAYVTGNSCGLFTSYDYATVKYNTHGVEQWVRRLNGRDQDDWATDIKLTKNGDVCVTGRSYGGAGYSHDYYTVKYSATGIEENTLAARRRDAIITTVFSGRLCLPPGKECRIFDIAGRVVAPTRMEPGIFFVEVDGRITAKVVKVR